MHEQSIRFDDEVLVDDDQTMTNSGAPSASRSQENEGATEMEDFTNDRSVGSCVLKVGANAGSGSGSGSGPAESVGKIGSAWNGTSCDGSGSSGVGAGNDVSGHDCVANHGNHFKLRHVRRFLLEVGWRRGRAGWRGENIPERVLHGKH